MNDQVSLNNQVLDALLVDYAAGALSQPLEILIETHLAMNPESAKTMQMLMQLGGILLEECEPVSLSEDALDKVMSAIAEDEEPLQKVTHSENSFLPRPISDYIPDLSCTKSWRSAGIGIARHDVKFSQSDMRATIYRIQPSRAVPSHSHTGSEITLVLAGGFSDESGTFGPGDIAVQEAGEVHKPVADADGECIVFAVNEGDIRLAVPFGRIFSLLVK
jgi:putative transcriptional regulator